MIDKNLMENLMELQKLATGLGTGRNWVQDLKGMVETLQGMQGTWSPQPWPSNVWNQTSLPPEAPKPHISIGESDREVTVTAYLPGIKDPSDLVVRVKNNTLQIIGRSTAGLDPGAGPQTFSRTISLPAEVESQGSSATYRNGTIMIRLKKKDKRYDHLEVKFI